MKTRLFLILASVGFLSLISFIPYSESSRSIMSLEEMAEKSDAIAIGTIQSTWIDIRLFDDHHPVVDTARIKVDEWLKNSKNSDSLEIRYYGYWAKTADDLRGISISGTPVHDYSSGQKVLVILDHEEDTAVMGGGYYPIFEGSFVIDDNMIISQNIEQMQFDVFRKSITNILETESPTAKKEPESEKKLSKENHPLVRICAYIGFEKYPKNLFEEFLESPYNKDVAFLNFTDYDLRQVPEFYKLIVDASQLDYPLNDRVKFTVSPEEHSVIKDHLTKREYFEFKKNGETVLHQSREGDSTGNYRTPRILMDGKLYSINGLSAQVFSDRDVNMNIQYSGTLEEIKQRLAENTNPNAAHLVYFEINSDDNVPLAPLINAISEIHKSKDKIRMSEDVGGTIQNKVQNFFAEQNNMQFNGDKTKHARYFILNETMYETSFVIC